jgi:MinD superfamily P-loop ATPase
MTPSGAAQVYDALTTRYTFACPAHGETRVRLSSFRALDRLPGAEHPAVFQVVFDCTCGGEHPGLVSDAEPVGPYHDVPDEREFWDAQEEPPSRFSAVRDLDLVAADVTVPRGLAVAYLPGVSDNVAPVIDPAGAVVCAADISNVKTVLVDGRVLKPMEGYGLKVMSMGFLVEEETPMIWRGPMVISALTQMLREVAWGELDILVVDMPPGTGDAQLTMAQQVPLAGAVIVSTPQDLALIDARKGLNMFRKVDVPLLGVVENMSYFLAPDTGKRYDIFGHGGAKAEAERLGVPFLGEVPLTMDVRETSDAGTPVVVFDPDGAQAEVYRGIARRVLEELDRNRETGAKGPEIVFE